MVRIGHAMPVRSLCFSPDSQLLVTASDDKEIKIYDVYVNVTLHHIPNMTLCIVSILSLSLSLSLSVLCSQHANLAGTLSGHSSWVLSVAFSPDNQHFATGYVHEYSKYVCISYITYHV